VADTPFQVTGRDAKPVEEISLGVVLTDAVKRLLANIQDYSQMAMRSLANLATGPRYFQDLLDQMDDIGVGSLPIVLVSGFFIGLAVRALWPDGVDG
jgi:ABC-type transporter Mla maintaining outer membrane lipid asymmetry permease subunit MlaE